jgi:phosphoglycerate dehydrogenase-like enzyme
VGFGAIGQAVARRVRAFEGQVIGVRRREGADPLADRMLEPHQVLAALPEADVVVLSLPLTAQTTALAGQQFFSAMKPGSVLVNVGRGGLVDEAALLLALDGDAPGHVLLDVFQTEPLPEASAFWSHPKVAVTPHAAARGSGRDARGDALFLDNLGRCLRGEPLLNEANPADVPAPG